MCVCVCLCLNTLWVLVVQRTFSFATGAFERTVLTVPTYLSKKLHNDFIKYVAIACSNMTELPIVFTFVHFSNDKGSIFRNKSAPPDC